MMECLFCKQEYHPHMGNYGYLYDPYQYLTLCDADCAKGLVDVIEKSTGHRSQVWLRYLAGALYEQDNDVPVEFKPLIEKYKSEIGRYIVDALLENKCFELLPQTDELTEAMC
jgi:hypothetical protein